LSDIICLSDNLGFERADFLYVLQNVAMARSTQDFSSSYRQVLYGGLSLVIVSFIWSSSSGAKLFLMLSIFRLFIYVFIYFIF